MDLYFQCITNFEDFLGLKHSWRQLLAKIDSPSLFQTFEWHESVLSWVRDEVSLRILLLYGNDELIGIAPFALYEKRAAGIRYLVLDFIKCPDNQICDFLLHPQYKDESIKLVAQYLRQSSDWTALNLAHNPANSSHAEKLQEELDSVGLVTDLSSFDNNWFISLNSTWESFYRDRSRRLKKGNNLVLNKLNQSHEWEIKQYQNTELLPESELIQLVTKLSANSWKVDTNNSLNFPGPQAFIRTLTHHLLENGWLSLWVLYIDGTPAAMEYQVKYGTSYHALRSDFDQQFSQQSPGTLLTWKLTEQLFHVHESSPFKYYLGPGTNDYKKRWTTFSEPLSVLKGYNHTWLGYLIQTYDKQILPIARTLRSNLNQKWSSE
ncbi:MAG TPA: hypothetical protein DCZ03_05585 [Gammaproteobacteria bacterium]|nr:hypothetical protein [Gammaproteobacteria bacterium]